MGWVKLAVYTVSELLLGITGLVVVATNRVADANQSIWSPTPIAAVMVGGLRYERLFNKHNIETYLRYN